MFRSIVIQYRVHPVTAWYLMLWIIPVVSVIHTVSCIIGYRMQHLHYTYLFYIRDVHTIYPGRNRRTDIFNLQATWGLQKTFYLLRLLSSPVNLLLSPPAMPHWKDCYRSNKYPGTFRGTSNKWNFSGKFSIAVSGTFVSVTPGLYHTFPILSIGNFT